MEEGLDLKTSNIKVKDIVSRSKISLDYYFVVLFVLFVHMNVPFYNIQISLKFSTGHMDGWMNEWKKVALAQKSNVFYLYPIV